MKKGEVVYGDPEMTHVFKQGEKINNIIKTKHRETVYCTETYAQEFYDLISGNTELMDIPKVGNIVKGRFVSTSNSDYNFDIGSKDTISVDKNKRELNFIQSKSMNDTFDIQVTEVSENPYYIKGSIAALYEANARQELANISKDIAVDVNVNSLTPAGYDISINYNGVLLVGFMPNTLAGINRLYDPTSIIGKTFKANIESYTEDRGTYIVSRRRYLNSLIPDTLDELQMGAVYEGRVTGTTPFGVFVEFNECLTGMIHKTNINPVFQDKINEIEPGTEIDFYIKEVIRKGNHKPKLILTQILTETLWDTIEDGQEMMGTVKSIKPFGVLIALDGETNGLIPQSFIDRGNYDKDFVEGEELQVKILSINRMERKIYLTA